MKALLTAVIISIFLSANILGQIKTDETKVEVNKSTGDTLFTESVIISSSEDITPRRNMILINPLKFFLFYNISYFFQASDNAVLGFGIQAPTISEVSGFGVNAELRFYPTGKNLKGFYFAPNISYNHIKINEVSTSPFSIGVLVGWQWFPGDEFAMGLGIGADHYFGNISSKDEDFGSYDGFSPALRFDIGYAW